MKRLTSLLCTLLLTVFSLQAQSLTGTWRTYIDLEESTDGMFWYLTFSDASDAYFRMTMRYSDKETGTFDFSYTMKGSYTYGDNKIHLQFDRNSLKMNLDKVVWNSEIATALFRNAELDKEMKRVVNEALSEGTATLRAELPYDNELSVIDLSENTLMVSEKGATITYIRFNH